VRCVNANRKKRKRLLRPSIPIGWRLRLLREIAFLAVFVYATHATQAIAFEWKPGFSVLFQLFAALSKEPGKSTKPDNSDTEGNIFFPVRLCNIRNSATLLLFAMCRQHIP